MANLLLVLWHRIFVDVEDDGREGERTRRPDLPDIPGQSAAGILLVLRRMRIPLIVLIVIFAVSVLGLTLVPGEDAQGRPHRLNLFEAFYFMSYTATTIGFGELPYRFTGVQRMWVTFSIFLSVIGWAYAIGSLLALMQDRAFREAVARRRFGRRVAHLPEPFLLLVGYGNAARRLAASLDDMGRRFVVLDDDETRVAAVDLASYRADTPALLGDARDTARLALAGLGHEQCEGVVVLTGDDETNLDVAMTTSLLRPGLPVIARTSSRDIAERMRSFGEPVVLNPLDRFGDHLRIWMRSPSSYRLMMWLTSAPGNPLPALRDPLPRGRWVVCGSGRFGKELTADLRAEGLDVTMARADDSPPAEHPGDRADGCLFGEADVETATAVVAATESDMTNLWLVERVRAANPDAFVVTLQNRAANAPLFRAVGVDFSVSPAELIAHEALARLASPALMDLLPQIPRQGEQWAARMVDRIVARSGSGAPELWLTGLCAAEAPALMERLTAGELQLGDLMRSPRGRERPLDAVPLVLLRDGASEIAPEDDALLQPGDRLLLAGRGGARRLLEGTLTHEPTAAYVLDDVTVPSTWVWKRLTGTSDH